MSRAPVDVVVGIVVDDRAIWRPRPRLLATPLYRPRIDHRRVDNEASGGDELKDGGPSTELMKRYLCTLCINDGLDMWTESLIH